MRDMELSGLPISDWLRAGWYLSWRIFVRIVGMVLVLSIAAPLLAIMLGKLGAAIVIIGGLAVLAWAFTVVPRVASQWAQERYGRPLDRWLYVWWGITWRSVVVSIVAGALLSIPGGLASALVVAYKTSPRGVLGGLVILVLWVVSALVSLVGQGWALTTVTLNELGMEATAPAPAGVAAASAPAASPAPAAPASVADKRQCPKCGLYETERGTVIGWYCRVCGWREARR
jgi:hypothetical protein